MRGILRKFGEVWPGKFRDMRATDRQMDTLIAILRTPFGKEVEVKAVRKLLTGEYELFKTNGSSTSIRNTFRKGLLPPPIYGGGYVFGEVCLSVGLLANL